MVRGGTSQPITWKSGLEGTVTLRLLFGEKELIIAKDLPPTGRFLWRVPSRDLADCRIQAAIGDARSHSIHFSIDSTAPGIDGAEIETPKD